MATQTTVIFCKKSITFTRAQLEAKAKKAAAKNPPSVSALHRIFVPGLKTPVSPNWFAVNILDTPVLVPNRIAIENGANADGAAMRGAYNPAQVLRAANALKEIGVKAESSSASTSYANYSESARAKLTAALSKMSGVKAAPVKANGKKAAAKKSASKKAARKPAAGNGTGGSTDGSTGSTSAA